MSSGANTPGGVFGSPSKDGAGGISEIAHSEVVGAHGEGTRTRNSSLSRTIPSQDHDEPDDERKPLLRRNTENR